MEAEEDCALHSTRSTDQSSSGLTMPRQLAGETAACAVAVAGVEDVERDRLVARRALVQLRHPQRADGDVDGRLPLAEEVAGNPRGRRVHARLGRLVRMRLDVHRVERDVAPPSRTLIFAKTAGPGAGCGSASRSRSARARRPSSTGSRPRRSRGRPAGARDRRRAPILVVGPRDVRRRSRRTCFAGSASRRSDGSPILTIRPLVEPDRRGRRAG